jgi:voltage-gated potassium channel
MNYLRDMLENTESRKGRYFSFFIQGMIILSLITFSIETLPGLSPGSRKILRWIEYVTVAIFTVEYVLRIAVSEKPVKFIFSFLGIVDLMAILPFYVATGIDLRSIRIVRLLRIFRLFKLFRYSRAILRFRRAFIMVKHELLLYLVATFFLLYLSSVGIYYFEHPAQPENFRSIFHSMWWAIATLTTVGYGDIYPITTGGKIFTFFILMIGLGIIAVPSGLLASALTKTDEIEKY